MNDLSSSGSNLSLSLFLLFVCLLCSFDAIGDIKTPKRSTLQIVLRTGAWVTLFTPKASECHLVSSFFLLPASSPRNDSSSLNMNLAFIQASQIRDLLEKFIMESFKSDVEFVRAIQDHLVKQQGNLLPFKKGEIIRVVRNSNMHLSKGESNVLCVYSVTVCAALSLSLSLSLSLACEFMSR